MTQTLDILDRLIGFPTVSADSNLDLINYAQDHLNQCGFETHRVIDTTGQKAGIYGVLGSKTNPGILLSGHTDVVPSAGQAWTKDPFKMSRENGRVYGRGTTDMKGYVASALALAQRAAKSELKEPLKIALSYDEEVGCLGMAQMIDELERTIGLPRACFVGEPTEMQVAIGHKGKAALRGTFHGISGHSAMAPNYLNALHLAAEFVTGLRDIQTDLIGGAHDKAYGVPYTTMHVGTLSGGTALNIVPDTAEMLFEYRHLAEDGPADLRALIDKLAADISLRNPGGRIEIVEYFAYPGLNTDPDEDIVSFSKSLAERGTTKVAFGTEAGYFAQLGIPTVVCGPGSMDDQGHKPDESIAVADLAACDTFMDRLLKKISR